MRGIFNLSRPLSCGALCVLLLIVLAQAPSPAHAADASTDSIAAPLAGFNLDGMWTFFETTLKSRARMLQFGIVGMCIALYFMFRARD